ncbi:hypothetical protein Shyhy01_38630 [Streptomyces hygroscopicus subsp. hygroscopicus]|uniref:condensation domain-containing protein n=1 Tax=Streptomyces sp. KHY 26 TaxID=3097359 RepID=UPI0024A390C2|nr:condensation domain-containing protein [Streptomyces hygroscopicus]GLX50913.1 hypothetical protein Shyhy01_38630 [Streptomyces hygroscopicus subsp. hygroscopicus]
MKVYPMTLQQEAMWLDDRMTEGPCRYLEPWVHRLTGAVDRSAVRWAWEAIVARHEALRTCYDLVDDQPVQRVRPEGDPLAPVWCRSEEEADERLRELVRAPMDLARGAVRATLLETGADRAILVVQMHHIVLDDWALHILDREFEEFYRARTEGRPADVRPVPLQPGPYALRQRSAPRDPAAMDYWRKNLADLPDDADSTLPADDGLPVSPGHGGRVEFTVGPEATRRLRRLAGRARVTPFTVFAAATALLLHAARGAEDLLVVTPVSLRGSADLDQMVAPLNNLLPLRLRVRPDDTFTGLLAQARARTHEAIEFRGVSIVDLVRWTRRRGRLGRNLYRTSVVLDDAADSGMDLPGVRAERLFVFPGTSKFDLSFFFTAADGGYTCMLDYASDRYGAATARRWTDRMLALLDRCTTDPDGSVASLVG